MAQVTFAFQFVGTLHGLTQSPVLQVNLQVIESRFIFFFFFFFPLCLSIYILLPSIVPYCVTLRKPSSLFMANILRIILLADFLINGISIVIKEKKNSFD